MEEAIRERKIAKSVLARSRKQLALTAEGKAFEGTLRTLSREDVQPRISRFLRHQQSLLDSLYRVVQISVSCLSPLTTPLFYYPASLSHSFSLNNTTNSVPELKLPTSLLFARDKNKTPTFTISPPKLTRYFTLSSAKQPVSSDHMLTNMYISLSEKSPRLW